MKLSVDGLERIELLCREKITSLSKNSTEIFEESALDDELYKNYHENTGAISAYMDVLALIMKIVKDANKV